MARIIWKEGKIFSIILRDKKFALLQMLDRKGRVAVFNTFSDQDDWNDISLTKESILFVTFIITKSIFSRSEITIHKNIEPVENINFPTIRISSGNGNRVIKVWENTENERELIILGEGNNSLVEDYTKYTRIQLSDYEKVKKYEMDNLGIYPEFNERLYLCSIFSKNIDPVKELSFNRKLDKECQTYIDIISGKVKLNKLGY